MPASKFVQLNTGAKMPTVGLGTWRSKPGDVEHAVEAALKYGYRHIDTATAYGNEEEVGKGIKMSGIPREELFLTTKLDNPDHRNVEAALLSSLQKLNTPYLDLWLMHWPAPMTQDGKADKGRDWLDTWKDMEKVYEKYPNKVKAIGVSNFQVEYLERLLSEAKIKPALNQIELHPSCPQHDVVKFCNENGIALTAYSPLGSQGAPLLTNEVVKKIAEKHNVSPANILISLQVNCPNTAVLPKSVTKERIESNFVIVDLTDEEVGELLKIDETQHFRAVTPEWTGWGHLGFPDHK
ncbi:Aldo/keto reductase [Fomitiporia mediterranea MF3/22]|uniref:Aldo/keto reductase n=1 Tax=Fomitiporia mediterranea (strain MF3/22) TaxID=694068 RepID=R7SJM0_FOMME|nr:Aldo/keto reductase [Fomitiporia mediterranea MF3/22]EJC97774.1 Aldo/keto reductase [Fomitiporia mediterranea MF3/22]